MSNASLAEFARSLVTLAAPAIAKSYSEMVSGFKNNAALAKMAKEQGLAATLASGELASLKKAKQELVTAGEKEAEAIMRAAVEKKFPDHAIVGEEWGVKKGSSTCWVFDPVDGTSAMVRTALAEAFHLSLHTKPAFGITIAVVENNEAVIGIVAELHASNGGLAVANIAVGEKGKTTINGKPVSMSAPKGALKECALACTVPEVMFNTKEKWSGYQALAEATKLEMTDLNCVGFMRLLGGGVDIAYESGLAYHDAAALVPLLQGAGITVTDGSGQALDFAQSTTQKEFTVLAAQPPLHALALACVKKGVVPERNSFSGKKNTALGYISKFSSS